MREKLEISPGLQAKTLFAWLQRSYPGRFADGQLRTLQRRIQHWRADGGAGQGGVLRQVHHPGRLGASDFTHMTSLGVTMAGQPFDHLVYHFVLTYSNWEIGHDLLLRELREPQRGACRTPCGNWAACPSGIARIG